MRRTHIVLNGYALSSYPRGIGTYTIRLIRALEKHHTSLNCDYTILVPSFLKTKQLDLPQERVIWLEGKGTKLPSSLRDFYWMFKVSLHACRHYPKSIFYCPAEFWSPISPERSVVTIHDTIYIARPEHQGALIRRIFRSLSEAFAKDRSAITTVSQNSKRDLCKYLRLPKSRIAAIPNWIDDKFLLQSKEKSYTGSDLSLPESYIFYIGGYANYKNVITLLKAFKSSLENLPATCLVLGGSTPEDAHKINALDVREAIKVIGIPKQRVIFTEKLCERQLAFAYSNASLTVYPSKHEGFGYPVLEAIAAGSPILASNSSSIPEIITNKLCLFDPNDSHSLALKMAKAIEKPQEYISEMQPEHFSQNGIQSFIEKIEKLASQTRAAV